MPTDRVLVEIVTAANMAGVEQAQAGFLRMNLSTAALGLALGALVVTGKAAIENTEKMEKAHLSLRQAADANKKSYDDLQSSFDTWAETNKRYIPDQYEAETALASFVRAGASGPVALRELNDALDLSIIKGTDMSTAQQSITLALAGNARGLKTLGITTEEYNAIMKNKHLPLAQKQADLLALIETKTKDGKNAQTDLQKSQNALNHDWQNFTTQIGPGLLGAMGDIVNKLDDWYNGLVALGKDNKLWGDISGHLTDLAGKARELALQLGIADAVANKTVPKDADRGAANAPAPVATSKTTAKGPQAPYYTKPGLAGGGPVSAGSTYLVGERGPETFVPGTSGHIIPNGGGGPSLHIHMHGMVIDGPAMDRFFQEGLRRARYAPGT